MGRIAIFFYFYRYVNMMMIQIQAQNLQVKKFQLDYKQAAFQSLSMHYQACFDYQKNSTQHVLAENKFYPIKFKRNILKIAKLNYSLKYDKQAWISSTRPLKTVPGIKACWLLVKVNEKYMWHFIVSGNISQHKKLPRPKVLPPTSLNYNIIKEIPNFEILKISLNARV